jgi:hypothetical protein
MSQIPNYQNLDWALDRNQGMKTVISNLYASCPPYLKVLDQLIRELRSGNCAGIQEKMRDVGDLAKFGAAVSELRIGRFLLKRNKIVTFLPDDYMGHRQSPDILAIDTTRETYVEVKLFTRDEESDGIISKGLREFLRTRTENVMVDVKLGNDLSLPKTTRIERWRKRHMAASSLKEFKDKFASLDFNNLPVEVHTVGADFSVRTSPITRSLVGVMVTCVFSVPDKLKSKLGDDICYKAKKRNSWTEIHKSRPYVVAIYCDQFGIDDLDAEDVLLGNRCTIAGNGPIPHIRLPQEIQTASQRGWREYLESKYLIQRDRTYLDWQKRGIYFTRPETRNVSGVIVGRESSFYCFTPNPFCAPAINDPAFSTFV